MLIVDKSKFSRWFNRNTINELLRQELSEEIIGKIQKSELLYKELECNYRNEFFYKNTLFNKLLLGRYSLNTSLAMSEIEINKSKADFALINKKNSFVVEIKTDLDTLDKLIYQIEDYYKVFSKVYVLTSENYYYQVYRLIRETNVGLMVLTSKNTISIKKKAMEDYSKLSYENLFQLLRKAEYQNLIEEYFKELPEIKPIFKYGVYLEKFKTIELKEAQNLVFKRLLRRINAFDVEFLYKVPLELRWLVYQSKLNEKNFKRLLNNLKGEI